MLINNKKNNVAIDKTLSKKIPYIKAYEEEGIIVSNDGNYTKMYLVEDVNPENAKEYNIDIATEKMQEILDIFDTNMRFQFVIHNRLIDKDTYASKVILDPKNQSEELMPVIKAYDRAVMDNIDIGHNNIKKALYLVISLKEKIVDDAVSHFRELDPVIRSKFNDMYGISLKALSLTARLKVMYSMFNPEKGDFGKKIDFGEGDEIDLGNLKYMKMTSKDLISPDSWNTSAKLIDYSVLLQGTGKEMYTRTFFINSLPSNVSNSFIADLTSVSGSMVFSCIYEPIDTRLAFDTFADMVKKNTTIVNRSKRDTVADRKAHRTSSEEIPRTYDEKDYFSRSALNLLKNSVAKQENIFICTYTIILYASDIECLDRDTELLYLSAQKFSANIKCLDMQQLQGFQTSLPLCQSYIDAPRIFSEERIAKTSLIDIQGAIKKDGLFCGLNSINDNLILLNRKNNLTLAGFIAGTEHSGKTFQNKREIVNALISTNDRITVITDTDEYDEFAKMLGGNVRDFCYTDIFDMEEGYGLDENDYIFKFYFLEALLISEAYIYQRKNRVQEYNEEIEKELDILLKEMSVNGNFCDSIVKLEKDITLIKSIFENIKDKYKSNIFYDKEDKRLTVYKVKNETEFLMMLDSMWNLTIREKKKNKSGWIFIDPADTILRTSQGGDYFSKYLEKANLFQTVITFVVQDCIRLMNNVTSGSSLEFAIDNTGYAKLLNLGPIERKKLTEFLTIPSALTQYVSNVEPGKGLIISASSNIAFNDSASDLYENVPEFSNLFSRDVEQLVFNEKLF
ncbi:MAG: hypothetical protein K6B41_15400 [Butyrivibrio sp.]|nr:hypothetical protein [Butyrivibrio sp.]